MHFLPCPVLQEACDQSRHQIQLAGHLAKHNAPSDQEEASSQESVPTVLLETSPNIFQLPNKAGTATSSNGGISTTACCES